MTEFIEFTFPCTDCLVAAACRDKKTIRNKDLHDSNGGRSQTIRCLALPIFNDKTSSYQKNILECIAELAWRVACHLNEDRGMNIPEQYRNFLIEYLGIFEYITNTTSWRKPLDEVAPFDKDEIKRKLNTAKTWLR